MMQDSKISVDPKSTDQEHLYEIDDTDPKHLLKVAGILQNLAIESNFATLPQLVAFATDGINRKLFVYETDQRHRLCIIAEREGLKIARILFETGDPDGQEDEKLIQTLKAKFNVNYITYNLLPDGEVGQNLPVTARREWVLDLNRLVNCANPDENIARNPNISIPSRAKEFAYTRRKYPYLVYQSFETANDGWEDQVEVFLDNWSSQTGLQPGNDRRLLRLFRKSPLVHGGMIVDTRVNKVVAINCFTPHPANASLAVSIIKKNLRDYQAHLGVLSYVYQALAISRSFPQINRLLIGGEGSRPGQTDFKEGFMTGGHYAHTYSAKAYCDQKAEGYFGEKGQLERENMLIKIWE